MGRILPAQPLILSAPILGRVASTVDDGTALLHCIWWKDGFERRHGTRCCSSPVASPSGTEVLVLDWGRYRVRVVRSQTGGERVQVDVYGRYGNTHTGSRLMPGLGQTSGTFQVGGPSQGAQ